MRGGTGLLTRDMLPVVCPFPPLRAVACRRPCDVSLTVAGQWRSFTALPIPPASGVFLWRSSRSSKFDSFLRRDTPFKGMFQQAHLRSQIRNLQDLRFGIAPRQDDVKHVGFGFQEIHDVFGG